MHFETFAKNLKQARKDAGYTQETAADLINIKRVTLASYEVGRTQPDIETLAKLAKAYHVSVDSLIGIEPLSQPTLTQNQLELLELFSQFDEREQLKIIGRMAEWLKLE